MTPAPQPPSRQVAALKRELREQSKLHNKLMASACREIAGLKLNLEIALRDTARLDWFFGAESVAKFTRECCKLEWTDATWNQVARQAVDNARRCRPAAQTDGGRG